MTVDELGAVGSKTVGHRNGLVGAGTVIAELDGQLLAENAAGRIDVGRCLFDAIFHLGAGRGVRAGDRAADTELDLGSGGLHERKREAQRETERGDPLHFWLLEQLTAAGSPAPNATSTAFSAPAQWPIGLIDPGILGDHATGARRLKAEKC